MAENAAAKGQVAPNRGSVANQRMGQMKRFTQEKKPQLISYETNPNMDWRQAAALNQANIDGYNRNRGNAITAMGGIAGDDVSGQAQMEATRQRGQNQLAVTAMQGGNQQRQREGVAELEGRRNTWNKNAAERENKWNREAANKSAAFDLMKSGVPGSQAQTVMQSGEFEPDVSGVVIPGEQPDSPNQHFAPHQYDNNGELRPGTGQYYQQPQQQQQAAPQEAIDAVTNDPSLLRDFYEKYGYLPPTTN